MDLWKSCVQLPTQSRDGRKVESNIETIRFVKPNFVSKDQDPIASLGNPFPWFITFIIVIGFVLPLNWDFNCLRLVPVSPSTGGCAPLRGIWLHRHYKHSLNSWRKSSLFALLWAGQTHLPTMSPCHMYQSPNHADGPLPYSAQLISVSFVLRSMKLDVVLSR